MHRIISPKIQPLINQYIKSPTTIAAIYTQYLRCETRTRNCDNPVNHRFHTRFQVAKPAAMLGGHCVSNAPKLDSSCGAGTVEEFAGLKTYFTGARDSTKAVLLCHDAFGYEVPNLRKLADRIAGHGYLVVVPDFFYGEPCDLSKPGFDVEVWFNTHHPRKGSEDAKKVVAALKAQGVTKIGAAGFCWGGLPVVVLASNPDWIQAGVIFHPVALTEDDMRAVKVPLAIYAPENDEFFPVDELHRLAKIVVEETPAECHHKIYPGTVHGWTTRFNEEDAVACQKAEEAHCDLLDWITKYVK
ncbi:OLC1v1020205C1 [Oldenlandia corymbosa var. corymbosa]|uniref:OLC1v1020205C1 n=1 Tax=Oldenlandia corymbosa var. corymbosa TaxID=529605 RepID=A0AAV1EGB3_OLDCO|nr:OLC1v1020205C1 [Oldenlandia corymbosa var. corymbosa]